MARVGGKCDTNSKLRPVLPSLITLQPTLFESSEGFAAVIEIILGCRMVLDLRSAVSSSDGVHLSDSYPLRPSFGARGGHISTFYSAVSTYDLDTTSQDVSRLAETMASSTAISGQSF